MAGSFVSFEETSTSDPIARPAGASERLSRMRGGGVRGAAVPQ
jgi:hypothetical protein